MKFTHMNILYIFSKKINYRYFQIKNINKKLMRTLRNGINNKKFKKKRTRIGNEFLYKIIFSNTAYD